LGRKWIGIEREDSYIEAALERIEAALPLDESALAIMQTPRQAPKVAFGTLIETGYLAPGAILTDTKRRWKATVRVDGSLEVEGQSGSIHGLGAKLQGAPSCNGWTFWQVETAEGLKPIDSLRQTYLLATEP
jgi:modification methylase